jgi:hypothetical protein
MRNIRSIRKNTAFYIYFSIAPANVNHDDLIRIKGKNTTKYDLMMVKVFYPFVNNEKKTLAYNVDKKRMKGIFFYYTCIG